MLKCEKCGFEGYRSDFKYVGAQIDPDGQVTSGGSYRRCMKCGNLVFCEDFVEDYLAPSLKVWGMSPAIRGKVFKGKKKVGGSQK